MLVCHLLATYQDKDTTLIPMDAVRKLQEAMLVYFKNINRKFIRVFRIHKENYRNPLGNRETKFRNFINLNLKIITVNLKFQKLHLKSKYKLNCKLCSRSQLHKSASCEIMCI